MRRPSRREWTLLAVVAALILVVVVTEQKGEDKAGTLAEARPAVRTKSAPGRAADTGDLDLAQLRREAAAGEPENVFASKSWYVPPPPPPPPPVVVAPVVPTAPPLPFTYLGQYADAGKPIFLLVKGDRILTVKEGEVIDGNYRVDGIAGSKLGLTYLPLNIKQTLETGNAG